MKCVTRWLVDLDVTDVICYNISKKISINGILCWKRTMTCYIYENLPLTASTGKVYTILKCEGHIMFQRIDTEILTPRGRIVDICNIDMFDNNNA